MTFSFSIKNRIGSENFDTIQTFFSRILSFGISLLFKILLARILTIEQNGLFGKWLASYNYAIIAFTLGLNLSLIYFRDNNKNSIINNFFGNILIYTILLVSCLIIGLFFTSKLYYYALFFSVFFSILEAIIGHNVTATNVEKITAAAIVIANSENSRPKSPSKNVIGPNTATKTTVVAITAKLTCRVPK